MCSVWPVMYEPAGPHSMAAVQLGRTLDDATVASIVAFLESLTGEVPAHYAPPAQGP